MINNVYGLADASLTWHTQLKKRLMEFAFKQSQIDPCLFFKGSLLFMLSLDDGFVFCPDKVNADNLIEDLKQQGYILTDEGPLAAYLGLQVDQLPGNRISMEQPAFIDQIIEQCGLKGQRLHDTPADTILHRMKTDKNARTSFTCTVLLDNLTILLQQRDLRFSLQCISAQGLCRIQG